MTMNSDDLPQDVSMATLFGQELSHAVKILEARLSEAAKDPGRPEILTAMADTVKSIRGASKLLSVEPLIDLAGSMEGLLRDVLKSQKALQPSQLNALKRGVEAISFIAQGDNRWATKIDKWKVEDLHRILDAHIDIQREGRTGAADLPPVLPRAPLQLKVDEPASDQEILALFFVEIEAQVGVLTDGLLALEANVSDSEAVTALMRAAHSIKGAARVLGLTDLIHLAHALEDAFQKVQKHAVFIDSTGIDVMLTAVDIFSSLAKAGPAQLDAFMASKQLLMQKTTAQLVHLGSESPEDEWSGLSSSSVSPVVSSEEEGGRLRTSGSTQEDARLRASGSIQETEGSQRRLNEARQASKLARKDRVVRVTADYLTRLMGLAGELLVESRWLHPFSDALLQLKKSQYELSGIVDILRATINEKVLGEEGEGYLLDLQHRTNGCRENLAKHLEELELFIRRHATLSDRLYRQVITSRMCAFGEGVEAFPRLVRDLAKQLGKKVRLEIVGRSTTIDRDILDKLKAPLNHLLRNAVDHGIEPPEERIAKGKPVEGVIKLEARHRAGVLSITVSDDGRGIDINDIRKKIQELRLVDVDMAMNLTEAELLDFLFLPGFTTSGTVTEISGRGIGLNVVQNMVHEVSGQVRVGGKKDQGAIFSLQLPLTLSVLRALLVEIGREAYAFPLARVASAMVIDRNAIQVVENREFYSFEGQNIGLIPGNRILELPEPHHTSPDLSVVILSDGFNSYGIVVDRLLGEKELVVQELDPRIGKVSDINCGAFMEDGSPILVIDVEDIVRSVDKLLSGGNIGHLSSFEEDAPQERRKRILVVDDSITVREVECRILENYGYEVDVAVNGVDGWNTVRIGEYDLVVTDVDMPRMNGIELVKAIKGDSRLHSMPVMIVSYKERSDDRMLGMEAGANYYLAKSSFHDDRFLEAVKDLIGEPVHK